MAATRGSEDPTLIERLKDEPFRFQFLQAVQLLEQFTPDRARIGFSGGPIAEAIRFYAHLSLSFPASEIQETEGIEEVVRDGKGSVRMMVNFMGLTGPMGVLPLHYTQLLFERRQERDPAFENFLNLFHHRLISLYYRAWQKYRPPLNRDPETSGSGRGLLSLAGLSTPALAERQFVADQALMRYAVYFTPRSRSCAALQFILHDYLEVEVQVEQFAGMWYPLDDSVQWRFGGEHAEFHRAIGDEVWDVQSGVRIRLGPLSRAQYRDFLPGGDGYHTLCAITRFFATAIAFEVQLVLHRAAVPKCRLTEPDAGKPGLGWDTWIGRQGFEHDPDDTIVLLEQ